jgi:hypothetical protein
MMYFLRTESYSNLYSYSNLVTMAGKQETQIFKSELQ